MSAISTSAPRASQRSGRSKFFALIAAIVSAFLLSACHFLGSGTITSANGHDKATFALNVDCTEGHETGLLTYIDNGRPNRVSVHATTTSASLDEACGELPPTDGAPPTEVFTGTYAPLDPRIAGGDFTLNLVPSVKFLPPTFNGYFSINFTSGGYAGYSNSGPVATGKIVIIN
ncbi:MAG: hypothetical protein M3O28_05910 [Actinomycetota bacterium]|nr:hypothetical protein [Actinomycetota bacterium]